MTVVDEQFQAGRVDAFVRLDPIIVKPISRGEEGRTVIKVNTDALNDLLLAYQVSQMASQSDH